MTKISTTRQKKEQIVVKLSEKIARAKALVFTNYQGLTHRQLEELKKVLKDLNAELVITKNTLLKLSLEKSNVPGLAKRSGAGKSQISKVDSALQNPTATLFVYDDVIAPLKQIAKTLRLLGLPASPARFAEPASSRGESRRAGGPTIKFGILDNQTLTGDQLLKLAMLPSAEVLLAQVVSGLKSPIFGLHRALSWNLQKLVMTLSAIQQKKN